MYLLITRDPLTGGELIVTRLESPATGMVIEGTFSLGWISRLTPDQLEFVRLLATNRGNVQKVAADLGIAYNTARGRLEDIAAALAAPTALDQQPERLAILDQLAAGTLTFDEALRHLQGR